MSKACVCTKNKNRKPVIVSIGSRKDEITGKPQKIEIVLCPQSGKAQPCNCGKKPFPGLVKVPEEDLKKKISENSDASSSGPLSSSEDQQADFVSVPSPVSSYSSRDDGNKSSPSEDAKKSSNVMNMDQDQDFTKLPIVSPRYHGPGCVLEVSVLEKHEENCVYRKLPNDKRHPVDDRIGNYEVVGRMVFKTCNPSGAEDAGASNEYESAQEETSQNETQIEIAQIIPMFQVREVNNNNKDKNISGSRFKDAKNFDEIVDLENILKENVSVEKLASSKRQFPCTMNASIQMPILASKEISTDDDIDCFREDFDSDEDNNGGDDNRDGLSNDCENKCSGASRSCKNKGVSLHREAAKPLKDNLEGHMNISKRKGKKEDCGVQKSKIHNLTSAMKNSKNTVGTKNVSTMTTPRI